MKVLPTGKFMIDNTIISIPKMLISLELLFDFVPPKTCRFDASIMDSLLYIRKAFDENYRLATKAEIQYARSLGLLMLTGPRLAMDIK